jgi:type I restriction enzyme, S subunit
MKFDLLNIDELGKLDRGRSRHRPRDEQSLYGGIYPFIQTGDVKHAPFYITKYTQTYNEKGLTQSKLWKKGTLCITIAANISDTAILGIDACFPDSILGFVPYENKSDVRFVKYSFDVYKSTLEAISKGTTQDNLSLDKLRKIKFKVPPFPIQRKIAAILSAYDDLIENNNRSIAILEKMAEEIYQEWFVRMRFPPFAKAAEGRPGHKKVKFHKGVPEGWKISRLKDFGIIVTGKTPSTSIREYFDGPYPFIKTPDMHRRMFTIETEESLSQRGIGSQPKQTIPEGTIFVNCIGALAGAVSITGKLSQTNQQINSIILNEVFYREYLYWCIRGLRETIHLFGNTGSTMINLSKGKFERLQVLKPSADLAKKYHSIAEPIFHLVRTISLQNINVCHSRDRLLSRLLSGKIDVENLDIHFPPSMRTPEPDEGGESDA